MDHQPHQGRQPVWQETVFEDNLLVLRVKETWAGGEAINALSVFMLVKFINRIKLQLTFHLVNLDEHLPTKKKNPKTFILLICMTTVLELLKICAFLQKPKGSLLYGVLRCVMVYIENEHRWRPWDERPLHSSLKIGERSIQLEDKRLQTQTELRLQQVLRTTIPQKNHTFCCLAQDHQRFLLCPFCCCCTNQHNSLTAGLNVRWEEISVSIRTRWWMS